jgi:hypothetical protein
MERQRNFRGGVKRSWYFKSGHMTCYPSPAISSVSVNIALTSPRLSVTCSYFVHRHPTLLFRDLSYCSSAITSKDYLNNSSTPTCIVHRSQGPPLSRPSFYQHINRRCQGCSLLLVCSTPLLVLFSIGLQILSDKQGNLSVRLSGIALKKCWFFPPNTSDILGIERSFARRINIALRCSVTHVEISITVYVLLRPVGRNNDCQTGDFIDFRISQSQAIYSESDLVDSCSPVTI